MSQQHASSIRTHSSLRLKWDLMIGIVGSCCLWLPCIHAQSTSRDDLASKVRQLTDAMNATQAELEKSQHELEQLRAQMASLQQQIADFHAVDTTSSSVSELSSAVEQIREQQSLQEVQIATQEQAKVETESKFPLKLSGLVLLTGFVNTTQVDDPVAPTLVLPGSGSTGASLRQTVVGFDARGPQLFGARTHADLRADFYGTGPTTDGAYPFAGGLLRLRTVHASVDWAHTQAFFALDHAVVAPNTPTSLTAVAVPALAWSGNLWTWNPQLGLTQDVSLSGSERFRMQGALIDVMSSPQIYSAPAATPGVSQPTTSEMSRWPGAEGRVAILNGAQDSGLQIGAGGLFVPHRTSEGTRFNSWADPAPRPHGVQRQCLSRPGSWRPRGRGLQGLRLLLQPVRRVRVPHS